jgi:hypothetical protein
MSELAISIAVNCMLGVILLALLIWKRTPDTVRLSEPDEAMEQFKRYFPEAVGAATVADDRRSALIDLKCGGAVGILQRQGRRWNALTLESGQLSSVELGRNEIIQLKFADFGWPRAQIRIADADARALWIGRLKAQMRAAPQSRQGLCDA